MREIQLTQNRAALVDDEDFEWLNNWKWYAHKDGNTFYAARAGGRVNGSMTTITMHSVIVGKPPKGLVSDHRDGNGLHNFKKNLRFVTTRQNAQNRKNRVKPKTSQYVGVFWRKDCKKWAAKIRMDSKNKHLGLFASEFQAFKAYRQAVESLGESIIDPDIDPYHGIYQKIANDLNDTAIQQRSIL